MKLIIAQVNTSNADGLRDYTLLAFLFISGIRVSELVNIRIGDIHFGQNPYVLVHGKGNKDRHVYFAREGEKLLLSFLEKTSRYDASRRHEWLFRNHEGEQLTRFGVDYIVKKYAAQAREANPFLIPEKFSTHKIRHSTAMALIESGATIFEVKDILGHASVATTEIYARTASSKRKNDVIASISNEVSDGNEEPVYNTDEAKEFLAGLMNS